MTLCSDRRDFDGTYVYLLGIYLGDGMLSKTARNVWRLRVFQDARYERIIHEIQCAMTALSGNASSLVNYSGHVEIYNHWKHWLCLFPQHGPGPKHRRNIVLRPWQRALVEAFPDELVRGLVQSDGCRALNRITHRRNGRVRTYTYPRYMFSNRSNDIRELFLFACAALGIEARPNNWFSISVAKKGSVAVLEEIVGPKR